MKRKKMRKLLKQERRKMTKKLAGILVALTILASFSGCGKEEEDPYSSPSFTDGKVSTASEGEATSTDASLTDALMIASYSDATRSDASMTDAIPASLTDALPMGVYNKNTYFNGLAEFKIKVDGDRWKFLDAVEVASATGATEDYVNNLWYGYKSPYEEDTTYAAIVSNSLSGSTIIVSYVNPSSYMMPDYSAKEYLSMAAKKYDNVSVRKVTFLGQQYECLDIPKDQNELGRRTQFAIKQDGMIILITFTMIDDTTLEEAVSLMTPLYY